MKKNIIIGVLLVFVLYKAIPLIKQLVVEIKIDKCLDNGGKWDYDTNVCIKTPLKIKTDIVNPTR